MSCDAERVFQASLDSLDDIRAFIMEACGAENALPSKRAAHLDLSIEEVVVNICSYAYEVPPGEVTVRVEESPSAFTVEFVDNGVAFDPLTAEPPVSDVPLDQRQVGGLGILLVRRMMDQVSYSRLDGLNRLRISVRKTEA